MKDGIYYCKICKKNKIHKHTLIYGSGICRYCSHFKPEGIMKQKHHCISCGIEIGYNSFNYGSKMCMPCSHKGKRSSLSKLHKEKISKSVTGENNSFYGKTHSEKTKAKISKANTGKKRTKEQKQNISKALKGIKRTEEAIENNRVAQIERFKDTKEREKQSLALGGTGIPYENSEYPSEFTRTLKNKIRERDNFICQHCGMSQDEHLNKYKRDLEIHHIDHDKFNCKPDNLITTCKKCNSQANFNIDYWYAYYTYIMGNK